MRRLALLLLLFAAAQTARGEWTPSLDTAFGAAGEVSGRGQGDRELYRVRARPALKWSDGVFRFDGAYDFASAWSKTPELALGETPVLRLFDLKRDIYYARDNLTVQNLDRLNGEWRKGDFGVKAGRQPLGHGSGRFFNPSDIFAPKNPSATWSEYKGGVDAVRFTLRLDELSEAEAWAVAHEDGAGMGYYLLRGRTTAAVGDLSAYGGVTLGVPTAGFDYAFDLGGAGCYLEGAARLDREVGRTLRAVAGTSVRAAEDLDLLVELFYNGPGEEEYLNYWRTARTREWQNGEIFTLAEHYLAAGLGFGFSPIASVRANSLLNLDDGSALFLPSADWSVTEYVTLAGGASLGMTGGDRTEFGPAPDVVYVEVKINL